MLKATLLSLPFLAAVLMTSSGSTPFATFNDPVMNFTFTYPDDFQALPAAQPQLGGCLVIPLRLKGKSDRPYERILVNEIDYGCLGRETPEIASLTKSTQTDLMRVYGDVEINEPVKFLLDGHSAAFIRAKARVNAPMKGLQSGTLLYGAQACVELDQRVACWNVLSSDQARLNLLLAGKVAFSGHPGQAWAPSSH